MLLRLSPSLGRSSPVEAPAIIIARALLAESSNRCSKAHSLKWQEEKAPALYEALASAFDLTGKSLAAIRPRLVLHIQCVVAALEEECGVGRNARPVWRNGPPSKLSTCPPNRQKRPASARKQLCARINHSTGGSSASANRLHDRPIFGYRGFHHRS